MIDTPGGIPVESPQVTLNPSRRPPTPPPPHAAAVCPPGAPLSLCLDGLSVAELGAGAGLPSLLAASTARAVVATDYPDPPLLAALAVNAAAVAATAPIAVAGLRWGDAPTAAALVDEHGPFDVVLMADLVSNHSAHSKLLATLEILVGGPSGGGVGVVAYGHHRVACVDADEEFFAVAADAGWHVGRGAAVQCAPMFADDPGVRWRAYWGSLGGGARRDSSVARAGWRRQGLYGVTRWGDSRDWGQCRPADVATTLDY